MNDKANHQTDNRSHPSDEGRPETAGRATRGAASSAPSVRAADSRGGDDGAEPTPHLVCYFSATGNSRHVARRLAAAFGGCCVAMDGCLQAGQTRLALARGASVGFVFPVYFWGLPTLVREFLRRVSFSVAPAWVYDVVTYGTTLGEVHRQFCAERSRRGWAAGGSFAVRMVDVWTPMFNLSDSARCLRRTRAAEPQIDRVVAAVAARRSGRRHWSELPHLLAALYYRTYEAQRRTARFHVLREQCVGCGLCARLCPVGAIALDRDGLPRWVKLRCVLCLRCLHHCPHHALHYGSHTLGHGQFLHPDR